MRRADRLFQLVQLLRSRRLTTGKALAEELGVSTRTVYRDIRDLERSGVPIRGEAGVGYTLHRDFELPPLTFNTQEIEALVLGARMVQAWCDDELAGSARSAMGKVEAVLPPPLRDVLTRIALFAPSWASASRRGKSIGQLRKAITDHRKLHLHYARADGQESERVVRPLALYFWGSKWSLAAWCELRETYRSFRPDRIQALTMLDDTFDGSDGITLDAFLENMRQQEHTRTVTVGDQEG